MTGLILASIGVSACTSSSGVDAVLGPVSRETTASVSASSGPTPPGEIENLINAQSQPLQQPIPQPVASTPPQIAKQAPVQTAMSVPERPRSSSRQSTRDLKVYGPNFGDAHPINFGRHNPKKFEVHGVDVSHWQSDIDWKTLRKQGANFAFIKATEGGLHVDKRFKQNWDGAKAAGIPVGAYHFMYWCRNAEEQAKWFIQNVPKVKGALPPVLDVEWHGNRKTCPHKISRARVLEKMNVWLDIVERYYGVKAIIYTAPDFYDDNLKGQFKDHSFWLRSVAAHPKERYPNRDFAFWQYSGTGKSKGVSTHIDLNVFNGDAQGWKRWLSQRVQ